MYIKIVRKMVCKEPGEYAWFDKYVKVKSIEEVLKRAKEKYGEVVDSIYDQNGYKIGWLFKKAGFGGEENPDTYFIYLVKDEALLYRTVHIDIDNGKNVEVVKLDKKGIEKIYDIKEWEGD